MCKIRGQQRKHGAASPEKGVGRTLYQCFFTLPSVLEGNVFAISLQLLPASLNVLRRCSSAGVQGVLVRPFFATGLVT